MINRYMFEIIAGGPAELLEVAPVYDFNGLPIILTTACLVGVEY